MKWSVHLSTKRTSEAQKNHLFYISNEDIESWTGALLCEELKPFDADSRIFFKNDVLFNKLRPYLAKVYHATFDGACSSELLCLRTGNDISSRFLFYVLASKGFIETIDSETFGAKMPRADWETIGHQQLPLPPLNIQQRIAAFLDEKTARIDGLIAKKRELLERLAEKRQALITQAVTKGLNPHVPMKPSGIEWLGDIPAHWEIRRLKEIGKLISGAGFPHEFQGNQDLPLPFFKVGDLGRVDMTKPLLDAENTINFETAAKLRAEIICNSDVVFAKVGAALLLNRFRRIECQCCIDNNMMAFRPSEVLNSDFALFAMSRIDFSDIVNKGAIPSINSSQVGEIEFALPTISEQEKIASFLRLNTSALKHHESRIIKSINLLTEYRSALITAAVTGQIPELR